MDKEELIKRVISRIMADESKTASTKELKIETARLIQEVKDFNTSLKAVESSSETRVYKR